MNNPEQDPKSPQDILSASELARLQKDLLWGEYLELRTHARHAETIRASAINFAILIAAALVAVITSDKAVRHDDLPMALILIFLGISSGLFSVSYAERYFRNKHRSDRLLEELDYRFFFDQGQDHQLVGLRYEADKPGPTGRERAARAIFQLTRNVTYSTHAYWVLLPAAILAVGIYFTIESLRK